MSELRDIQNKLDDLNKIDETDRDVLSTSAEDVLVSGINDLIKSYSESHNNTIKIVARDLERVMRMYKRVK